MLIHPKFALYQLSALRFSVKRPKSFSTQDQGYTMVEIVLVLIILGILAAIALPSLLSQGNKAKVAGALASAGAVNRAQLAYHLDHKSFADNIQQLGLGPEIIKVGGYQPGKLNAVNITDVRNNTPLLSRSGAVINTGNNRYYEFAIVAFVPNRGMVGLPFVSGCSFKIDGVEESLILQGFRATDIDCTKHRPGRASAPVTTPQPSVLPQPVTPGNVLSSPSPKP